ncbi:MAG: beta-ketoacyl-[acyl-carrier-protein] synthase family protein [Victivallaceae bacterium]
MSVCITGMGCISPAGISCAATWDGLQGDDAPGLSGLSETGQIVFSAPLNPAYDSNGRLHRSVDLLNQALDEAFTDAGLNEIAGSHRIGVCIGTTSASFLNDMDFHRKLREHLLDEKSLKRFFSGNPAEYVKKRLALRGPAMTVINACASGTDAIGVAMSWLNGGICDIVIAGGADEIHSVSGAGFHSLGVTSQHLCRPFDRDRDGLNLGEGAAVLILETMESAARRKRVSGMYVEGYAAAGDARHITQPDPEGLGIERAIRQALKCAGLKSEDIGFINAHGTGTIHNDLAEGRAFARIFAGKCPYFSTKGKTGHTLGAAGAIEAVITAIMLKKQQITGSCRHQNQDPEIPFPPAAAMKVAARYALSTSLAFGGCNSALILKYEGGAEQ